MANSRALKGSSCAKIFRKSGETKSSVHYDNKIGVYILRIRLSKISRTRTGHAQPSLDHRIR